MKQSSVSILLKIICVIIALTAPLTGHSPAYEQSIPEDHYRLARWDIPIVQLVITSAREDPHDENLLYIDATIEEVLRRGDPRLPHGPILHNGKPIEKWHDTPFQTAPQLNQLARAF